MNIYWSHVLNINVVLYVLYRRAKRKHLADMAELNQRKKAAQEELRKSKEWLAATEKGLEEVQKMRLKWAIMKIESERGIDT